MPDSTSDQDRFQREFGFEDLSEVANELLKRYSRYLVWLLEGTLGSGKTTLAQELGRQLEISDDVSSPTFSLVNQYQSKTQGLVYHLDLYRLKTLEEGLEIGLFEIADSGYFCLIEWASAIDFQPAVPYIRISLEHTQNTMRRLSVNVHEN